MGHFIIFYHKFEINIWRILEFEITNYILNNMFRLGED